MAYAIIKEVVLLSENEETCIIKCKFEIKRRFKKAFILESILSYDKKYEYCIFIETGEKIFFYGRYFEMHNTDKGISEIIKHRIPTIFKDESKEEFELNNRGINNIISNDIFDVDVETCQKSELAGDCGLDEYLKLGNNGSACFVARIGEPLESINLNFYRDNNGEIKIKWVRM